MYKLKYRIQIFLIVYLVILGLCLFFYSNALHSRFIWDDELLIVKNPLIRDLSFWHKPFTNDLFFGSLTGSNFYRPIQTLTLMWDYHFWQLEPFGYHMTNILLQSLVSFLVFLFLFAILSNLILSFVAALLFALNPLAAESVTYISGRAELLMGLFLLSSLLLFIKSKDSKKSYKVTYLSLALFLFTAGLLSKELVVVFPLVILVYVFYFARAKLKDWGFFVKSILPFFIIDIVYIALRLSFLNFVTIRERTLETIPLLLRLSILPKIFFTYIKLLFIPINLHMSWVLTLPEGFWGIFWSWFLLGIIVVSSIYILVYKRDKKILPFMLFWYLIYLVPQSGILPINAFVAEHFIYLSSISFFTLISYLLYKYLRKGLFIFSICGLILFYGISTFSHNFDWVEPLIFFEKIIKFSPTSFQAHNNLGQEFEFIHQYDLAIREYKKALELRPQLLETHSNLANLYFKMGRFIDARKEYQIAKKLVPNNRAGGIENNIASIYEAEGQLDMALDKYKLALRLDPSLKFTHFNIARIHFTRKNTALASQEILESLVEIKSPVERGEPYLKIIEEHLKSVNDLNCSLTFYNNLGVRFARSKLFTAAISCFRKVLELEPRYADAHFNLGLSYWKTGLRRKAIFEFKTALKLNPNHPKAARFLSEIIYKK